MLSLYREFYDRIDLQRLTNELTGLWRIELGQTFENYRLAACEAERLLKQSGVPNVERIEFPADGKTSFQDKCMPLAWHATIGKLTLLEKGGKETVAADYQVHPFHLIKGSVSTPPGGIVAKIMTESQFLAGENASGALLMLNPTTWPRENVLVPFLDEGGIGIITDFVKGRYLSPDGIAWVNAGTERGAWHVTIEDRDFIGFSVTPKMGDAIREKASSCVLYARAESDGKRSVGTFSAITGLIPGRKKQEIWGTAHLYEPLINDNSSGVCTCVEIARQILAKGMPEFSVRLVFAMEYYGFAAYAASRGEYLGNEVIGGVNFDGVKPVPGAKTIGFRSGAASPFYGNYIIEKLADELNGRDGFTMSVSSSSGYQDDSFLSDGSLGVPMLWPIGVSPDGFWHNSMQNENYFNPEYLRRHVAFDAAIVWGLANPSPALPEEALTMAKRRLEERRAECFEELEHLYHIEKRHFESFYRTDVPREAVERCLADLEKTFQKLSAALAHMVRHSQWRDYAEKIVVGRACAGFPHDLTRVEPHERIPLPDGMIYSTFANVLSNMDGKKDLARLIREAEYETSVCPENKVRKIVHAVEFLTDWGYLRSLRRPEITGKEIQQALSKAGISPDDVLLVHPSLSRCGYIPGGSKTVIDAIQAAVGENGAALYPVFQLSFFKLGDCYNRNYGFRSADRTKPGDVWTGKVAKDFLRLHPEAFRSAHITHSWAGIGETARACLADQQESDPPGAKDSPMGKVLERNGKILFFGASLSSSTFLHFIESQAGLPGLGQALCRVKNPDGTKRDLLIENHFPGHRDFYREDALSCKFYRAAVDAGLKIVRIPLGMDYLTVIGTRELYEIGMKLVGKDPNLMLCDDPGCVFCRDSKRRKG